MIGQTRIVETLVASLAAIAVAGAGTVAAAQFPGQSCRVEFASESVPIQDEPVIVQGTFTESIGSDFSAQAAPESNVEVVSIKQGAAADADKGHAAAPGEEKPADPSKEGAVVGADPKAGNESGTAEAGAYRVTITLNTSDAVAGQWGFVVDGSEGQCTGSLKVGG